MATVIITGAGSGFGLEAALAFSKNGDVVYATMRDTAKAGALQEAADRARASVHILPLDVTKPESFPGFVERVLEEAGSLDVLVNNAGVLKSGALEDIPESVFREVMETNFFGAVFLTRAVLPTMRSQGSGLIINVSSLSGLAGLPLDSAYAASKFALEGATEAMRHEVDRFGIRVALIEPGLFATGLFDQVEAPSLPDYVGDDSPYRRLSEFQKDGLMERIPDAPHASIVANVLIDIAKDQTGRLRWPADARSGEIASALLGKTDAERDDFLKMAGGVQWWSEGKDRP